MTCPAAFITQFRGHRMKSNLERPVETFDFSDASGKVQNARRWKRAYTWLQSIPEPFGVNTQQLQLCCDSTNHQLADHRCGNLQLLLGGKIYTKTLRTRKAHNFVGLKGRRCAGKFLAGKHFNVNPPNTLVHLQLQWLHSAYQFKALLHLLPFGRSLKECFEIPIFGG